MKTIDQLTKQDLGGKKVLLRVDFNVPIQDGKIVDDFRVKSHINTIKHLVDNDARVAIISHMSKDDANAGFKPHVESFGKILGQNVAYGGDIMDGIDILDSEQVVMFENIREHKEEKENDDAFGKRLTQKFDLYVSDAFGVAHRAHASVVAVTKNLPSYAGLVIKHEVETLQDAINAPRDGKTLLLGGAKISTKLPVITNFTDKADDILVGGAIVNHFLKYQGHEIGKSLIDENEMHLLEEIDHNVINMPRDYVVSTKTDGSAEHRICRDSEVNPDDIIVDLGPESAEHFAEIIERSKIVIWNGPMGITEVPDFAQGTEKMAQAVVKAEKSFIGGGDSIGTLEQMGVLKDITHVSTGGGAMLTFLAGERMPGLEALGYYENE